MNKMYIVILPLAFFALMKRIYRLRKAYRNQDFDWMKMELFLMTLTVLVVVGVIGVIEI